MKTFNLPVPADTFFLFSLSTPPPAGPPRVPRSASAALACWRSPSSTSALATSSAAWTYSFFDRRSWEEFRKSSACAVSRGEVRAVLVGREKNTPLLRQYLEQHKQRAAVCVCVCVCLMLSTRGETAAGAAYRSCALSCDLAASRRHMENARER